MRLTFTNDAAGTAIVVRHGFLRIFRRRIFVFSKLIGEVPLYDMRGHKPGDNVLLKDHVVPSTEPTSFEVQAMGNLPKTKLPQKVKLLLSFSVLGEKKRVEFDFDNVDME